MSTIMIKRTGDLHMTTGHVERHLRTQDSIWPRISVQTYTPRNTLIYKELCEVYHTSMFTPH